MTDAVGEVVFVRDFEAANDAIRSILWGVGW
jgi:hypothetical protein